MRTNHMGPMAVKQPMDLKETKKDATIKDFEEHCAADKNERMFACLQWFLHTCKSTAFRTLVWAILDHFVLANLAYSEPLYIGSICVPALFCNFFGVYVLIAKTNASADFALA